MLVHMCNELLEIHINTNQKERLVVWAWSILVLCHDITEILLKVALNTITLTPYIGTHV
jgi:hypothetical protein